MEQKNHSRPAWLRKWLLAAAIIVLCSVPFFRSYEERERTPALDEIYWVGQAYYYHLAVEQVDWTNPDWQLLPAWENPQLGRGIIGLGLQLNGLSVTNLDWLGYYYHIIYKGWGQGHERDQRQAVVDRMQPAVRDMVENQEHFEYPAAYLTAARVVMLIFGVLAVILVFVLTSLYTSEAVAFLAALGFSLHPAVATAYTHVGVDILAIVFSLLTVVHFELIRRCVWRRCSRPGLCRALICITGGLSLAFAVGSKLNAVIVGFLGTIFCLSFIGSWLWRANSESKDSCKAMFSLLVISLVVFVGSNPVNFPHPLSALWSQYAVPQRILEIQKEVLPGALLGWGERVSALSTMVAFHPMIFVMIAGAFLVEVMAALRAKKTPTVIAVWWLLSVTMVAAWLPFARPLHVLPVIAPSVPLIGCAMERLFQAGRSRMVTRGKIS